MKQINLDDLTTITGGSEVGDSFCWIGCGMVLGFGFASGGIAIPVAFVACGACL